ncbi:MAG: methyl-accepting chemotaxis protein [Pseudomonadota bacterium]
MASDQAPKLKTGLVQSLFFKCTLIIAACTIAVVATIETKNYISTRAAVVEQVAERADEVSRLLSLQLGGAVRFANADAVGMIVEDVIETAGQDALGALVVDRTGSVVYSSPSVAFDQAEAEQLAQAALQEGAPQFARYGKTAAIPLVFGGGDAQVGVVVTAWTMDYRYAEMWTGILRGVAFGLGALFVSLMIAAYLLRWRVSKPIRRLNYAMARMAQGDFDTPVPARKSRDEIGEMGRQLDAFRVELGAAEAIAREATIKGAAFTGSTAPSMLVDEAFKITVVNPACTALVSGVMPDIATLWPGIDPDHMIGQDLRALSGVEKAIDEITSATDGKTAGYETSPVNLKVGTRTLQLRINPVTDDQGNTFGYVIEWDDFTEALRNAALTQAIDTSQLRVQFDTDGRVSDANDNFLAAIGGTFEDTKVCSLPDMFAGNFEGDADGSAFAAQVWENKVPPGRYKAYSAHAQTTFLMQGCFAPILNDKGEKKGLVFIGTDVTEQEKEMQKVQAERMAASQEQSRVMELLGGALNSLSDGDLEIRITEDVPPSYEKLRNDFNGAVAALGDAIGLVVHNTESIRSETKEITSAADDLSRRTEKQAATLEETAAALDELTASVRSAADGANKVSGMSEDAQRNAEQGGVVASDAMKAMDGIKNSSQEISKITNVIDDIAFQTNLLALNAGVEAARAGEAGRGFAVVATEVRALAQRSSDAASEINALISSSGEQVQQGVDLVDRTGTALASIVSSVKDISSRVSEIARSSAEQSAGLAEINTAINELDHVTQQNAAMFEETTAASHALTAEADALTEAVMRFRVANAPKGPSVPQPENRQEPKSAQAPGAEAPKAIPKAPAAMPKAPVTPTAPAADGNAALDVAFADDHDDWEEF